MKQSNQSTNVSNPLDPRTDSQEPAIARKAKTIKYRPVLTSIQIEQILHLAKLEQPISSLSMSLISTLAPFKAKIDNAGIQAAYSSEAKVPLMESLGSSDPHTETYNSSTPHLNKEAYWEQCFNKYQSEPSACTLEEIQGMREHKYLNDLMNEAELTEFENETVASLSNEGTKL